MKEIHLPCGKVAFVSDEDWPLVSQLSWYDRSRGYPAARFKKSVGGDGKIITLHRLILRAPDGYVVDHIDGNTLNNQRENLQVTTNSRNLMKSSRALNGGLNLRDGYWYARMRVDGRIVRLGRHRTKEEAQSILDAARVHAWSKRFNLLGTKIAP